MTTVYRVPDLLTLLVAAPHHPDGVVAISTGGALFGAQHVACATGMGMDTLRDRIRSWDGSNLARSLELSLFPTGQDYGSLYSEIATPRCAYCEQPFNEDVV